MTFQTKDFERLLEQYTIRRDGTLVRHPRSSFFSPRIVRDVEWPIHGDIRIYQSVESAGGDREWVEYRIRFTNGRAERADRVDRPGTADQAPTSSRPSLPRPPAGDLARPSRPGLHGRRLTADEFTDKTPEKLELIDGAIPGGEDLLLLLLIQVGLRHAALLVGPELWRAAITPGSPDGIDEAP